MAFLDEFMCWKSGHMRIYESEIKFPAATEQDWKAAIKTEESKENED